MFSNLLGPDDTLRASHALAAVLSHGLGCALTGSLAVSAQLRSRGRPPIAHRLNDIDLVVAGFESIPRSLVGEFLINHVHPHAAEGKILLQLISEPVALRIDLFRAFGDTLARAAPLGETGSLPVLSVEDLLARTTAMVYGALGQGQSISPKHVRAFLALQGLGEPRQLAAAWDEHRQTLEQTIEEAGRKIVQLIEKRPELLVEELYSTRVVPCDRCRPHGPFRLCSPEKVVQILGYW